ncbi:MAG: hypothetical protein ABIM50_11355 [Novosphingobium sp.]
MADPTTDMPNKPAAGTTPSAAGITSEPTGAPAAKERFARALDEAKAGAQQLGKEAQERAEAYREKATAQSSEWIDEAKDLGNQAKDKAFVFASEGKAKASEAISGLSKLVEENAATIDQKVGPKYGDYARSAARTMQGAAEKIDAKDLGELGEDAKQFVRKSPGIAVAIAAAIGFVFARLFKKTDS